MLFAGLDDVLHPWSTRAHGPVGSSSQARPCSPSLDISAPTGKRFDPRLRRPRVRQVLAVDLPMNHDRRRFADV